MEILNNAIEADELPGVLATPGNAWSLAESKASDIAHAMIENMRSQGIADEYIEQALKLSGFKNVKW